MKVWNKRTNNTPSNAMYVGRPTRWGNPYVPKDSSIKAREEVIEQFRVYAEQRLKREPDWLEPLRGKDLVCWCAPLPCHADILLELANR